MSTNRNIDNMFEDSFDVKEKKIKRKIDQLEREKDELQEEINFAKVTIYRKTNKINQIEKITHALQEELDMLHFEKDQRDFSEAEQAFENSKNIKR